MNVVLNEHALRRAESILQDSVSVHLGLIDAAAEEALPLVLQVEWVEFVAKILCTHLLHYRLQLGVLEAVMQFHMIDHHSRVDFSRVFRRLWRVILEIGDLIVMAERSQYFQEFAILNVDLRELPG